MRRIAGQPVLEASFRAKPVSYLCKVSKAALNPCKASLGDYQGRGSCDRTLPQHFPGCLLLSALTLFGAFSWSPAFLLLSCYY